MVFSPAFTFASGYLLGVLLRAGLRLLGLRRFRALFGVWRLCSKRRTLAGSLIGGIPETQEMLDFCARHHIVSDIEMVKAGEINEAYDRMLHDDVKYRFVIDCGSVGA